MKPADDTLIVTLTVGQLRALLREANPDPRVAPSPAPPEVLDRREAAKLLRVSLATLNRIRVPRHLVGCTPRYVRSELVAWVKSRKS